MHAKSLLNVALVILAVPVAAGCGGGGSDKADAPTQTATQTKTTKTKPPPASRSLTIRMTEFAFKPQAAVAKGGKVTITAQNTGNVVHELVVLKTKADPAKLPQKSGKVDESTSVGEIADVQPATTKKTTLKLAPGKYAMVCALPGHYQGGMYGSLTVK